MECLVDRYQQSAFNYINYDCSLCQYGQKYSRLTVILANRATVLTANCSFGHTLCAYYVSRKNFSYILST